MTETLEFCRDLTSDNEKFLLSEELFNKLFRDLAEQGNNSEEIYMCWQNCSKMYDECSNINMDKTQMLLGLINETMGAVR